MKLNLSAMKEIMYVKKTRMSSGKLEKEDVESAIKEGFIQYAEFILQNNIPIAKSQKEEIAKRLEGLSNS